MPELVDGRNVPSAEAVYGIIWAFTAIAIFTTALRLCARVFVVRALGLDDALIFGSLVSANYFSCVLLDVVYNTNR